MWARAARRYRESEGGSEECEFEMYWGSDLNDGGSEMASEREISWELPVVWAFWERVKGRLARSGRLAEYY